jgi:elongation factor G
MDKENARFDHAYNEVKTLLSASAVPVEIPVGAAENFRGIVNLFSQKAHIYKTGTQNGEYDETDPPEEAAADFAKWEAELQETLATTDEALLERFLEGEEISRDEAIEAMALATGRGEVVPVFCGAPKKSYGVRALLKKMVELFPNPGEVGPIDNGDGGTIDPSDDAPFSALVFKTTNEPHVGELSYFRVFSGQVTSGAAVSNPGNGSTEKLNHLSVALGKERLEVPRLHAGDIGVVAKLRDTHTNDTLCQTGRTFKLAQIPFPKPDISVAVRGADRGDEDKLGEVLARIHEEDPTFHAMFDPELGQTIARGLGELHLDVQFEKMKRKFGVSVETERPKIAYRETITVDAKGHGRHKKQSGGRGQFGDCWIRLKPLQRGAGYVFESKIKGGVVPSKYLPSVDRGIAEAAQRGVLAGFPLVDFAAECYDGSYHAVDSSDIAFKLAGSQAFKTVAKEARPVLLEPIMVVNVTAPDAYVGDIMGDLNQRRGRVQGMLPVGGRTTITARVPEAELYKYAATLRSITQGRGHHERTFVGREPMSEADAQKVIAGLQVDA